MKRGNIVRWDVQEWQASGNWSLESSTDYNSQLDALRDNDASLETLLLANCNIEYDDLQKLVEVLQENETVTLLNLSYNRLTYREAHLVAGLVENRSITVLKLYKNDLGCEGCEELLPILQGSTKPGDNWYHQYINSGGLPNDWCMITSLNLGRYVAR